MYKNVGEVILCRFL